MTKENLNDYCILRSPPIFTSLRLNLKAITKTQAIKTLSEYLEVTTNFWYKRFLVKKQEILQRKYMGARHKFEVKTHPDIDEVLIVKGRGPMAIESLPLEVYVDAKCGRSVMRGAAIYASGIVGSNRGKYSCS